MKLLAPLSVKSGTVWLRKVIALKCKMFGESYLQEKETVFIDLDQEDQNQEETQTPGRDVPGRASGVKTCANLTRIYRQWLFLTVEKNLNPCKGLCHTFLSDSTAESQRKAPRLLQHKKLYHLVAESKKSIDELTAVMLHDALHT